MEFMSYVEPGISVRVDCWNYSVGDRHKVIVGMPNEGAVTVTGDWPEGVDKKALEKDLAKAIGKVVSKHCDRKDRGTK